MRLVSPLLLLSTVLVPAVLAVGGVALAPLPRDLASQPPVASVDKQTVLQSAPMPVLEQEPEKKHHHFKHLRALFHHHHHKEEEESSPDKEHSSEHSIGSLFKRAFKYCGAKIKRVKHKADHGLEKLSKVEKKIHHLIGDKLIKGSLRIVGNAALHGYMVLAVALEPIVGSRIVRVMDKMVGGAIFVGKKIGRFLVDHMATIVGIGIGLLVSLAVTAGLSYVSMNPIVGGAIGGAAGALVGTTVAHVLGAIIHGNLIPTSIEEAAKRTAKFVAEAAISTTLGAGIGAASAGIGAPIAHIAASEAGQAAAEMGAHTIGHFVHTGAMLPVEHVFKAHI